MLQQPVPVKILSALLSRLSLQHQLRKTSGEKYVILVVIICSRRSLENVITVDFVRCRNT